MAFWRRMAPEEVRIRMCVGCVAESSERREDREHREAQTSGNRTERTGTSAACRSTREIVAEKPRCRDRIFFEETCPSLLTVTQIRETNAQLQEDQSMYPPKKASPRSVRTGALSWDQGAGLPQWWAKLAPNSKRLKHEPPKRV